jgi:hypothetical protein
MQYAKGTLASEGLPGAARLLHGLCFDPVKLEPPELSHEPRWSCQCRDCASVWIASKSGDVMCIDLKTHPPTSRSLRGNREARTIYHLHHGAALGGGSFLLIGRDDGALDIVADPPRATIDPPPQGFYLASWWASLEDRDRPRHVSAGFARRKREPPMGITAISVLHWGPLDTFDILVATREPALYVLEAADQQLWLRRRRSLPGWIQWILGPPDDQRITCISRGGDIVRFAREDLLAEREPPPVSVPLLPTAAMPFDGASLLLGTTRGLFLVRDGMAEIALPVTREPVLCLDRAEVSTTGSSGEGEIRHDYITMGLEDGRLRIIDAERLQGYAEGKERPAGHDHSFTVDVGDAVLAVETLQADDQQRHTAYVLTVLRDHSVRLFHVTSQEAQRARVEQLWIQRIDAKIPADAASATAFAIECDEIRSSLHEPGSDAAWRYMLVDVVLPRLCTRVPKDSSAPRDAYREIAALACAIADGDRLPGAVAASDRLVLHRLSTRLEQLTGSNVDLELQISRSILRAIPRGSDEHWDGLVESHLRDLHAMARRVKEDEDRYRLVGWARFVRKFVLLGHTFAAKRFGLGKLVAQNYEIRKYLDAVVYQTRLLQRRHDLWWESRLDASGELAEVAELHAVSCGGNCSVVVVVTVDGKIALVDADIGQQLELRGVSAPLQSERDPNVLAPFRGDAHVRTLACAVVRLHGERPGELPADTEFRVVLGCSASDLPRTTQEPDPPAGPPSARLAVLDFRWTAGEPPTATLLPRATQVAYDDHGKQPLVYAVQPLPSWSDAFAVGLETPSAPVGLLEYDETARQWKLELASDEHIHHTDGHVAPRSERLPPAPGTSPTRALAVVFDKPRARCLLVAGSDDGLVRAISFALGERPQRWQIKPWDRLPDAVSSLALGRTSETPQSRFTCYLGTAAGDTFALAILDRQNGDTGPPVLPFGDYDAQALWRDTHDGPVLAVRMWPTESYEAMRDVLVVVTENGRICIYNHSHRSEPDPIPEARADTDRQSAAYNYFFRGLRLDRVTLPGRLRAWTRISGDRFVAAGPRELYMGELAYLRNSKQRPIPDWRRTSRLPAHPPDQEPDAAVAPDDDGPAPEQRLEGDIWARIRRLLDYSRSDEPFKPDPSKRRDLKLDLCDLVRLEGGALSAYVLRARWPPERWHALSETALVATANGLLRGLDPENREDAERIKIILRSMCRAFLFHDLDELRHEILDGQDCMADLHARTATVCTIAANYLKDRLAPATVAAARLRIVVVKELLRVQTLRRMAVGDEHSKAIRDAVESVLGSCLQDDQRLVRIEAMRALSIALRNAGVMAGRADGERVRIITALFPHGLRSVEWILGLTVGGLLRFPSFTQRTAMVSGAWHLIWALLPLFHLFRGHTLALCDYLVRNGLDVEVLAMCSRSLRGKPMPPIRSRIVHLYLLPKVQSADEYVLTYDRSSLANDASSMAYREMQQEMALPAEPSTGPEWHELGDGVMAERLLLLLDRLARMWRVADHKQMQAGLPGFRATPSRGEPPPGDAPLAELERMVDDLAAVAERLANARADEAGELDRVLASYGPRTGPIGDDEPKLTTPIRAIVAGIVGQWRKLYKPALKAGSTLSSFYELGSRIGSLGDDYRSVFELNKPENLKKHYLIKVFERSGDRDAVRRFLEGAWVNHELSKQRPSGILEVKLPLDEPPAYVIRRYASTLEPYLTGSFVDRAGAINDYHGIWCIVSVAGQIADALHAIHTAGAGQARRYHHGDVKPATVLIRFTGGEPSFHLGDFYRAHRPDQAGHAAGPVSSVPDCLLNRPGPGAQQWGDVAGLSLILYRMLTGEALGLDTTTLDGPVQRLRELAGNPSLADRAEVQRIIETVRRVFEDPDPMTIQQFRDSVRLSARRATAVPRDALPASTEREAVMDRLKGLNLSQFEEVLFRARVPREHLSGPSAPQATRAMEVINYFEQRNLLEQLKRIIDDVEARRS